MPTTTVHRGTALFEYISPREYGDIIRYQEIERVTDTKRYTTSYYNAITKAKKLLETAGKMIVSIEGGDYRVIYPGDYTSEYVREVKRAKKRITHGKKILDGAPVKDMTENEKQVYDRVYDFNSRLSAQFSGSFVEVKKLTGKPHPMEAALNSDRKA